MTEHLLMPKEEGGNNTPEDHGLGAERDVGLEAERGLGGRGIRQDQHTYRGLRVQHKDD